jgi:hypothetical protein
MITTNTNYYYISNRIFYKLNLAEVKKGKKTVSKNGKENISQDNYIFNVIGNDQDKQSLTSVHILENDIGLVFDTLEKAKASQIQKLEIELQRVRNIKEF